MKSRKGFTLIELLVVISIIAIISAIVFPAFTKAREKSRQTVCLSNLKQLGVAMRMYADDWDGCLPAARIFEGGEGNPYGNWAGCYIYGGVCDPDKGQLSSYVKSIRVYMCPSSAGVKPKNVTALNALPYPLSYSMNAMLSYKDLDVVVVPSRVGFLIHEDTSTIDDGDFNWMGWAGDPEEGCNEPNVMHNGGTCLIYCDLHAKWQSHASLVLDLKNGDWYPDKP